jgi:hypothetical protein
MIRLRYVEVAQIFQERLRPDWKEIRYRLNGAVGQNAHFFAGKARERFATAPTVKRVEVLAAKAAQVALTRSGSMVGNRSSYW